MTTGPITLTSDFGHKDPFAGIMKGVILGINPDARIIDLSHGVAAQDILAGALVLSGSVPFFPDGTIHVAVVDPGVGSERQPVVIESERSLFVGPDNGIFTLALKGQELKQVVELSNDSYHLKPTSKTFHGRDIFAPVAAHLSLGVPVQKLGHPVKDYYRLDWPEIIKAEGAIQGEIVYIDGFGNLITNIYEDDLKTIPSEQVMVSLGDVTIHGLAAHYSQRGLKGFIALINSWGLLEICLFKGNAHLRSGAKIGKKVHITDRRVSP